MDGKASGFFFHVYLTLKTFSTILLRRYDDADDNEYISNTCTYTHDGLRNIYQGGKDLPKTTSYTNGCASDSARQQYRKNKPHHTTHADQR
jgi:hypothetical protein